MATEPIDPFYYPPRATADKLLSVYLTTVHPLFPIMWKSTLIENYDKIYGFAMPPECLPNSHWTTLNLVFAIGQTFLTLVGEDGPQDVTHGEYFMRARVLGALDGTSVFSTAELEQVRILGLCGIYLLASHHTNRCVSLCSKCDLNYWHHTDEISQSLECYWSRNPDGIRNRTCESNHFS
jgi:hypothetical protein